MVGRLKEKNIARKRKQRSEQYLMLLNGEIKVSNEQVEEFVGDC